MQRLLEILFGAERAELPPGAETAVTFDPPQWMGANAALINTLLIAGAAVLVLWVYARDGRRPGPRIGLAALRVVLFAYLLTLINRPVLRVTETRSEPSVIAVLIDTSISGVVRDTGAASSLALPAGERPSAPATLPTAVAPTTSPSDAVASATQPSNDGVELIGGTGPTRLDAAVGLLTGDQQALIRKLAQTHAIHFYRFSRDASSIGTVPPPDEKSRQAAADGKTADRVIDLDPKLLTAIKALQPDGGATQVVPSLLTVLGDLQGQRLAGVVVITDGRETPASAPPSVVDRLKKYGTKIYSVPIGAESPLKNVVVTGLSLQESAFKDDMVTAKVTVRAAGYEPGKTVRVRLKDKKSGLVLKNVDGREAEAVATLPDDRTQDVEIVFQPKEIGTIDIVAEADIEEGELSRNDNVLAQPLDVLDGKINVLYVDGYPRWEYRYIKNELIRDKTVNISCLLTSADRNFSQEGDRPVPDFGPNDPATGSEFPGPITRFPEKMEELRKYHVILFGDVDPRQFTDRQIQMLSDYVSTEAGGFGMISGPQFSPLEYRNTALEAVLPVTVVGVQPEPEDALYRDGWRPVVTDEGRRGEAAMMFRFFPDKEKNEKYLREDLQPLFWFCRGIAAKSGIGLVYAEHPIATDPTGRKAPLLVLGRFGAGRTLFSAIDDSWRWRYYTGESVFDTYWVQQIRYLARGKKLAERGIRFAVDREKYERGEQVKVTLTVLDPTLLIDLPPQIRIDVVNDAGQLIRQEALVRQESPDNLYSVSFPATDRFGSYRVKLPDLNEKIKEQQRNYQIIIPRLELERPEVDRAGLLRLMPAEQVIPATEAREKLPLLLTSAAKTIPIIRSIPLWDNPLTIGSLSVSWLPHALAIFMLLLTTEWVLRKVFGML
ncbi:hypothetical protein [Humisphaera borealis]|uniref:VWFA domain-containing protein n=1 Tax=Humisphaera borealis TaxID=2807512 RepID=A0A7M2WX69_9BACT|nr:hypothetical protein [Humisphaera borealis]QOV89944.1 hypothetical protein IPV69_00800 [Humisphaera borealis]